MDIKIERHPINPLIVPGDIKPSHEAFKVEGVFNAGAALYKGKLSCFCGWPRVLSPMNRESFISPWFANAPGTGKQPQFHWTGIRHEKSMISPIHGLFPGLIRRGKNTHAI